MRRDLRSKLVRRIDRRVDVPAELLLSRGESLHDILKWRVANDQEIDVTRRAELAPCPGSEHERNLNAIAKWRKPFAEQIDQPDGLCEQASKFREDWRFLVGLKVHLPAPDGASHQPRRGQELELTLNSADSGSGLAAELPKVVGLVRMAEQPAKHAPASASKEQGGRVHQAGRSRCSQDENKSTQTGNVGQAHE